MLPRTRPTTIGQINDLETRRWRVYVVLAMIAGFSLVLVARLVDIQILQSATFRSMATDEHWRRSILPPRRGDIVDVHGSLLATSVTYQSLYASPREIANPAQVARSLAPIVDEPAATIEARLAKKQAAPVLIKPWLPDDAASRVKRLNIGGLFLQPEPRRAYPEGGLAAQTLGVVGVDNNGLSGVERQFDADVAGKPGELVAERDTSGDTIAFSPRKYTPPVDGSTITLTLDRYVQWVAERELDAAITRLGARGGSVVVLDPRTGAVLALAGRPSFRPDDPNLYSPENVARYGIPAISELYEPAATFQILTMAAALDSGVVTPNTSFTDPGTFTYYGGTVQDTTLRIPGPETITGMLMRSSNVGASWVATRVGAPRFYQYLRAFGIGRRTGIELPGEASGSLRLPTEPDWYPFDLATNAFGQGVSVTPLQLAAAVAVIANGGSLMKPYLVKQIDGAAGHRSYYPTVVSRVIRPETAAALTRMLVAVVDDASPGAPRLARVQGYAIAGIAGTTEVPVAGGDGATETIASFAGFAPAEAPRFVVVVRIDRPKGRQSGDEAAAPVFGAIVTQLLEYDQVPPSRSPAGAGSSG